jgi:hypothetical protein
LSRKSLTPELLPPKVPAYIVTFSDMVTLLLTFFVMLQTLAHDQDAELFNKGRDSFIESIRYIGLGVLFGRQNTPPFGNVKTKHYISDAEQPDNRRTIDADRERMRRILGQMARFATVMPSDLVADKTRFWVTTGGRSLTTQAESILPNSTAACARPAASKKSSSTCLVWPRTSQRRPASGSCPLGGPRLSRTSSQKLYAQICGGPSIRGEGGLGATG